MGICYCFKVNHAIRLCAKDGVVCVCLSINVNVLKANHEICLCAKGGPVLVTGDKYHSYKGYIPGFTCWISFAPVFSLIYC